MDSDEIYVPIFTNFGSSTDTADFPSASPSWGAANTLWQIAANYYNDEILVSSYSNNYVDGHNLLAELGTNESAGLFFAWRELNASTEDPDVSTLI